MDHSDLRQQQPGVEIVPGSGPMSYPMASNGAPAGMALSPPNYAPQPFNQVQHIQSQQQKLQAFWANQMQEINHQVIDFKNHSLPLARIKKIMKADEDVRMISSEAPVIFAKACEMFILELTLRSWINTEENKRRTLQKNDIAAAISRTDVFDFLVDIIPRDEVKEECLGVTKEAATAIPVVVGSGTDGPPYYYVPPQNRAPLPFVPYAQQEPPQKQQSSDS